MGGGELRREDEEEEEKEETGKGVREEVQTQPRGKRERETWAKPLLKAGLVRAETGYANGLQGMTSSGPWAGQGTACFLAKFPRIWPGGVEMLTWLPHWHQMLYLKI